MRDMMLSEAEKARIAANATAAELAAARAREREAIAREAAARVRAAEDAQKAKERAERARKAADLKRHRDIALLRQASELVGRKPVEISLLYCSTRAGTFVYINPGEYRYTREHLCSFNTQSGEIRSTAALVSRKPALARFCASLMGELALNDHVCGSEYTWPAGT